MSVSADSPFHQSIRAVDPDALGENGELLDAGDALLARQLCEPSYHSDLATSKRLAEREQSRLRHAAGTWLEWDGRRWRDDPLAAVRAAKVQADDTLDAAIATHEKDAIKLAVGRCQERRIAAAAKLAASDRRLAVEPSQLDNHPDLLNVGNGVLDLRTGELREHDPALLLTKLAGAEYDPDARSETWQRFLADATGEDDELATWLQRAAGYAATGHASEEVVIFLHGPGQTGKTTLAEALRSALGEHAATADFASFLAGRNDASAASPDIARLAGVRLAVASEVMPGQSFNPSRLKSLTGSEQVTARRLYRDPIQFVPAFVLLLAGNERPSIPATDSAAWRRMRLVPLTRVVPEGQRDKGVKAALVGDDAERRSVLAWIAAGARDWYAQGLGTCAAVKGATVDYRAENDALGGWLRLRCELDADARTPPAELHASHEAWCREDGHAPLSAKAFGLALKASGVAHGRGKSGAWYGLRVTGDGSDGSVRDFPTTRAHRGVSGRPVTTRHPSPDTDADGGR
jgi:P4 family phage/plasmid primase-like protien